MMQTQRTLTEKKTASPLLLLALVGLLLTTLHSAYYPSLANAQQGPTTITATGMLVGPVDDGDDEDPTPEFRLTDEEAGRTLNLTSGFVDLEDYAGQRVTIEGVRVPGIDPNAYNVTQIRPADEDEDEDPPMSCQSLDCPKPGNPNDEEVKLSFELEVEGEPPAEAEFLGLTATESLSLTPLTDPDGDGTYTGSKSMAKFAPGPTPPGTEPISISPVRIVQGPPTGYTAHGPEYRVIKDFGTVKLDGDKTLSASVSFEGDGDSDNDGSDSNGGSDNGGSDNGGSDNGGSDNGRSDSGGSGSSGGSSGGSVASGMRSLLPSTGGSMALTLLGAGVLMTGGGLLVRRIFR